MKDQAKAAAEAARVKFRQQHAKDMEAQAKAAAMERRNAAVQELQTANDIPGVLFWVDGNPKAGAKAYVVYNKQAGPLQPANSVAAHVGADGWVGKQKKVSAHAWPPS